MLPNQNDNPVNKLYNSNGWNKDTYAQPKESIDQVPNYDKLNPIERGIYGALPSLPKNPIVSALTKFGDSWMGKALSYLDVGAEGIERTFGTAFQYGQHLAATPQEKFDWSSAWYASSMFYDTQNLPSLKWEKQPDGKSRVVGLEIPQDLPGMGGLADMRKKIQQYTAQGMTSHDALTRTRDEYYNGLGALALRSQLQDTFGHILLDPVALLMPELKPVERLQASRYIAMTSKFSGTAEEALRGAEDLTKAAKLTSNLEEAATLTRHAEKLTVTAERVRQADELTKLASDAMKSGKLIDSVKFANQADKIRKEAGLLTTWDKFAVFATGGDLFNRSASYEKLRKSPLGLVMRPFELTPESKATELMNLMADNYGTRIFASIDKTDPNWVAKLQATIGRISSGSTGVEFGHGLMTLEGRTAQAFSHGVTALTDDVFKAYNGISDERNLLRALSEATSFSPTELIDMAEKDKGALMRLVVGKASPELQALIDSGALSADSLETLAGTVKKLPYTDELLQAHLMDAVETHAMQQAVVRFGVKQRGLVARWSSAMKAAETMAFMRLNPAYAIRNVVNNDVTMIARGVMGFMSADEIDAFWKTAGFVPKRLEEAFSSGSNIEKGATAVLQDVLKGKNYGAPEKIQSFFRDIQLGKLDVAAWSRLMEQKASRQAFTKGYMQFYQEFAKPEILTHLDAQTLNNIPPEIQSALQHAEKSAMGRDAVFDQLIGTNLNVSPSAVLDEASKQTGYDVREFLGTEGVAYLNEHLGEAIRSGKLDQFSNQLREQTAKHVEDMFNKHVADLTDNIKNQAIAGGPQVWYKSLGDTHMMWLDGEIEHAVKISPAMDAVEVARSQKDWGAVNGLWRKIMADDATHFGLYEKRMNAVYDGLEQAWKALKEDATSRGLGFDLPDITEVRKSFNETRTLWKDFFDERTKTLGEFFDAKLKGADYSKTWDQIQSRLEARYKEVFAQEGALSQRADDAVASMIPDQAKRQAFMNYRDQVAKLQDVDRKAVLKVRQQLRDATRAERPALWHDFWTARQERLNQTKYIESAGTALMQDDPKAAEMFTAQAAEPGSIYDLANKYGISSASDTGAPNDRRILNTVNKYAPKEPGGVRPSADLTSKAESLPRSELPPDVSEGVKKYAQAFMDELHSGQAGQRIAIAPKPESATNEYSHIGIPSTNAEWYRELYNNFHMGKPEVDKALQKIIDDQGKDTGIQVERLKKMIIDRIAYGDPKQGLPPDFKVLRSMGVSDEGIMGSLDAFNEATRQDVGLEEALKMSGFTEQEARQFSDEVLSGFVNGKPAKSGYSHVSDIPLDVAKKAFDARAAEQGLAVTPDKKLVSQQFIADIKKIVPDIMPRDLITEQAAYGRFNTALDGTISAARTQAQKTPSMIADLPEEIQAKIRVAIQQTKDGFADSRLAATRYGEFRRDAALLNYNRRSNFDNTVSHGFPFVFWTTGSMMKWAIESIDRPAMLTDYLRTKKLLETAGAPESGFPSRFKDSIKIKLPFAPEWMGSQYIDPLRMALPFDAFTQPIEQWQQTQGTLQGRAERLLQNQLSDGQISQKEYDDAVNSHAGPKWDWAVSQAQQNDDSLKFDAWDFASTMASPHAPITWAYNLATGHPENIGPLTPETRIMRNAFTAMGVTDWSNSPYNVEAKIRKTLGLPAFDKYDTYRTQREITNLITTGKYTVDQVKRAMILADQESAGQIPHDQAMQDPLYAEAVKRANQEYTGGPGGFLMSLIGLNVKSYPEGEQQLRQLGTQFQKAYEIDQAASKKVQAFEDAHPEMDPQKAAEEFAKLYPQVAKDSNALTAFFDAHPEYEARLGLFDKPEVRLQKFLVDKVWEQWNSLPTITRKELQAQLGPTFNDAFLNKDTRSYTSIPSEEMSIWLKLMGGDPPGTLSADQKVLADLYSGQLKLTAPETAWRADVFYNTRKQSFPDYFEKQNSYYKLPVGVKRSQYLRENPDLQKYWNWRTDFMRKNPDLVPYLTDNQKQIAAAQKQNRNPVVAIPTARELSANMPEAMTRLLSDSAMTGAPLPAAAEGYLAELGRQYHMTPDQLRNVMSGQMAGVGP